MPSHHTGRESSTTTANMIMGTPTKMVDVARIAVVAAYCAR